LHIGPTIPANGSLESKTDCLCPSNAPVLWMEPPCALDAYNCGSCLFISGKLAKAPAFIFLLFWNFFLSGRLPKGDHRSWHFIPDRNQALCIR
jgi:hypothetical protein